MILSKPLLSMRGLLMGSNLSKTTTRRRFASKIEAPRNEKDRKDPDRFYPKNPGSPELWERLFYFVAVPAILIAMVNTYLAEREHQAHWVRPEFKRYEYMRVRTKKFPWGDGEKTLFHNPRINPLPDGWEELPGDQQEKEPETP